MFFSCSLLCAYVRSRWEGWSPYFTSEEIRAWRDEGILIQDLTVVHTSTLEPSPGLFLAGM